MPNYKKLYHKAFNALTDAQRLIQAADLLLKSTQAECEQMFVETPHASTLQLAHKHKKPAASGKIT
ncbi:hypothetical protein U6B65_01470 [Oscillospiraceae bacterium MB08-C2-2]|nr:hypothetical protein U6B65_01470 [Oscillospiraceae bacterium MB08-C2-2]